MRTNAIFNSLVSSIGALGSVPILGSVADNLMAFAIFYKDLAGKENILFLENTARQTTKLSAQSAKYPTEMGHTQAEFKFKEPTEIRLTGLISRKGTGIAGMNFSISSLALQNPLQDKSTLIKNTLKDLDFLISNNVLCEVWALNGGKRSYMTLTGAETTDDLQHKGLFEVDLSFVEIQSLILEPEPLSGALSSKVNTGACQITSSIM